MVMLPLTLGDP